MAASGIHALVGHLEKLTRGPSGKQRTDRQLLDDFATWRDETAFAELVNRHGPLVLRVCQRVLQNEHDAEDAFQATFLVLAQRVGSIHKRESLAAWLYGVAYRTALRARRGAARRRHREARAQQGRSANAVSPTWDDVQVVLDEEIQRLPATFRAAFILCVLEGKTVPAAAAELQCKEGTVSSRVGRARQRLQQQLARRGIQLAAVLAALGGAASARAMVPSRLLHSAIRFGLLGAAGGLAVEQIPSNVAALAAGVTRTMFLTHTRIATAVCLAVSLLAAGAVALMHQPLTAREPQPPQARKGPPDSPKQDARPPAAEKDDNQTATYAGRVLDPDGKPFAGAKLYLLYYTPKVLPIPVRGTSGADGRFRFTVARAELDRSSSREPWKEAIVVAVADGHGLAVPRWEKVGTRWDPTDQTLQLVKDDVAVTGRVLDLQGQPVAGVRVKIQGLHWPRQGNLAPFLRGVQEKKVFYQPLREHLFGLEGMWMGRDVGTLFPVTTTGADGRFQIKGVGRERLVNLRLDGPTIVTRRHIFVTTRPGGTIQTLGGWSSGDTEEPYVVHSPGFDHLAAPCKPIVGVVRDKETGKSIPGAVVTSYTFRLSERQSFIATDVQAIADQDGRYSLTGLPKGLGTSIRAGPPEGQPYLMAEKRIGDTPGLAPLTVDFALQRGVWISGKVLDKVTRQPVHAQIEYVIFADNPHRKEAPALSVDQQMWNRPEDGTFRVVGLPGRGLIGARATPDRYRRAVGLDKVGGRDSNGLLQTYPHLVLPQNFHTLVEVNPAPGTDSVPCEIVLDPGRTATGTVLDPEGKPLAGALWSGGSSTGSWEHQPLKTAGFTVSGLEPGKQRLLQFAHPGKRLAGFLLVKGNEDKPLTVQLGLAATLLGRLVTPAGKPVTNGEIRALQSLPMAQPGQPQVDWTRGSFPRDIRPDKEGRFRIEGLAPGLKYKLGLHRGIYLHELGGNAVDGVTIKAGETKDLGDVEVKPIE